MSKLYRFENGFVGSYEEYVINNIDKIEKVQTNNNMQNFRRVTFNRKDYAEQLTYITRLFKKKIYQVYFNDGFVYDVDKKAYDKLLDVYTDKHLFKREKCFDVLNKYDADYKTVAKEWLNK